METMNNNCGHLQPQAVEMEKAVLGALMIDSNAYAVVCDLLSPESFYEERHQLIYEAIQMLSTEGIPVDVLLVSEQLVKNGTSDKVGGLVYIRELASNVASSANIEYHAKIVAQKYLARQMIDFCRETESKVFDETFDVNEAIAEAKKSLMKIQQQRSQCFYQEAADLVKEATKEMMTGAAKDGITGIASGFQKLDDITAGWQPSDLIIITGRPSMGKTSFALSMALNIVADYNVPTAFFSLEMSNEQLAARLISNACEINSEFIISGQLTQEEWGRLDKRVNNLIGIPLFIDDTPGISVSSLCEKARRMVYENNVKIIFVDNLQLVGVHQDVQYSDKLATICEQLKKLAKELNIPIIALCQLNRGAENPKGLGWKRPHLSDLQECEAIEQIADVVVFVHRPEYYRIYKDENGRDLSGLAQIIVARHRKGCTGHTLLTFRKELSRFENLKDNSLSLIELEDFCKGRFIKTL